MFGVGALPYAMCNNVVGLYFIIFLLEVVIVSTLFSLHDWWL